MDQPAALIALLAAACSSPPHPGAIRADEVVDAPTASDGRFGDPELAVDGVRGGGRWQGSLDVFALGLDPGEDLVLGFEPPVVDRDGPDLAVFENPFDVRGGGRFFDPVVVEVSADCASFVAFPHEYAGGDWTGDPADWVGFAGITPVRLDDDDAQPVDPLSDAAGGDRFDLADLGGEAPDEVACVRLSSASASTDPDGVPYPHDPASNGPDIDGVYGRAP